VVRTLCVANQKGGVGKTTTCINLAAGFAKAGYRTLVVDLDPQCNATSGMGESPASDHPFVREGRLPEAIRATRVPGLSLVPGCREWNAIEMLMRWSAEDMRVLRRRLEEASSVFDEVLIDCPPSLGGLTRAALSAADEVLMPIQCEYFAMEGLTQMIHVIREVMRVEPGRLEFGGILMTMYDERLELTREVEREVREFFGEIAFETVVPRDVAVAEAPSHGMSVLDYGPRTRGARAYVELCMEVLNRDEG